MKKKKIHSSFSDYFNYSSRERKGTVFLALILLAEIIFLIILKNTDPGFSEEEIRNMDNYVSELQSMPDASSSKTIMKTVNLFAFDPNSSSDSSFEMLGLNSKQISVIRNYLSHGGKFRTKNDFKKIYSIPHQIVETLSPFLLLPDSLNAKARERKNFNHEQKKIDISIADSSTFLSLRGIGPILASRILKYRQKLGGFISIDQIKEVWGINDTTFNNLLDKVFISDTIPDSFIHLNSDSFQVISSHPYLHGKIASLICSYRKQHGKISDINELRGIPLITDENFRKLAPYIRLD